MKIESLLRLPRFGDKVKNPEQTVIFINFVRAEKV
jgi:hypothetical protein